MEFEDELIKILDTYTECSWNEEPLDADEVDTLVEHLRNQLNLINGNITEHEYQIMEGMASEDNIREDIFNLNNEQDIVYKNQFIKIHKTDRDGLSIVQDSVDKFITYIPAHDIDKFKEVESNQDETIKLIGQYAFIEFIADTVEEVKKQYGISNLSDLQIQKDIRLDNFVNLYINKIGNKILIMGG